MSYDISREYITTEFMKGMWKKINIRLTVKNFGESHLVCCLFCVIGTFFFWTLSLTEDIYVCVHDIPEAVPSSCLGTRKVILLQESRE
jgi:hypothetical protein